LKHVAQVDQPFGNHLFNLLIFLPICLLQYQYDRLRRIINEWKSTRKRALVRK
jgi:hypothetical protein